MQLRDTCNTFNSNVNKMYQFLLYTESSIIHKSFHLLTPLINKLSYGYVPEIKGAF